MSTQFVAVSLESPRTSVWATAGKPHKRRSQRPAHSGPYRKQKSPTICKDQLCFTFGAQYVQRPSGDNKEWGTTTGLVRVHAACLPWLSLPVDMCRDDGENHSTMMMTIDDDVVVLILLFQFLFLFLFLFLRRPSPVVRCQSSVVRRPSSVISRSSSIISRHLLFAVRRSLFVVRSSLVVLCSSFAVCRSSFVLRLASLVRSFVRSFVCYTPDSSAFAPRMSLKLQCQV